MSTPVINTLPQWEWTLISTISSAVTLNTLSPGFDFYYTSRPTGEDAPDAITDRKIPREAIKVFRVQSTNKNSVNNPDEAIFEFQSQTDLYVFCFSRDNAITTDGSLLVKNGVGNSLPVNPTNGAVDTNAQDQTTPVIIVPGNRITDTTVTTSETVVGGRVVDVASTTGIIARNPATGVAGSFLIFYSDVTQRVFIGRVIGIAGSTLTFDTPFDSVFSIGADVDVTTTEMNVDGSGTPVVFGIRGPSVPGQIDAEFDITRMIITITCTDPATLATFGDISPPLLRGVVLRHRNGTVQNVYNIKSNGELATICYDLSIYQALNPAQGQNGVNARLTFAGQNKIGVVLRLGPGEDLEVVIQDDLTTLERFGIIFEGHVVD